MIDRNAVKAKLVEKLQELSGNFTTSIDDQTEIYYDVRISGDDWDELIEWIAVEFGTDFTRMEARKYSPGEAEIYPFILKLFGKRPYESITIRDLLDAIERNRWQGRTTRQ